MTRPRLDTTYANPFLDWIRIQKQLDSYKGYRLYDIDGLTWHTVTRKMMLLETKMYNSRIDAMKQHQKFTLEILERTMSKGTEMQWVGTYLVTFQNTSPCDGYTIITKFDGVNWIEETTELNEQMFVDWYQYMLS